MKTKEEIEAAIDDLLAYLIALNSVGNKVGCRDVAVAIDGLRWAAGIQADDQENLIALMIANGKEVKASQERVSRTSQFN